MRGCANLLATLRGFAFASEAPGQVPPAAGRAQGLVALVRDHLPIEGPDLPPQAGWPLVGPALIARQAGTLEAILRLAPLRRSTDPLILARSLYDHAVTFAWLGAEPGQDRLERFLKTDAQARLRVDDDCRKIGEPMLSNDMRARFQAQVDEYPNSMPDLAGRAELADEHWAGRLPGLRASDSTHSYRGLYAIAYRRQSALEHASLMGLNPVIADLPGGRKRIDLEGASEDESNPLSNGALLLGFSLYIASDQLGWPPRAAIGEVFDQFTG